MSSPASTVNIHLVTTANLTGANQVNAALNGTGSGGNPWVTASRNAAQHSATLNNNVVPAQTAVAGGSRNMGNALLQASRGIQDLQYGLAGAVNNLEGIASALGLGAGVAGVVTVLAVALQQVAPHLAKFFNSFDLAKSAEENMAALKGQILGNVEAADGAAMAQARFADKIKESEEAVKNESQAIKDQTSLLFLRLAAQKSAADYQLESDIADVRSQGLPQEQEKQRIADLRSKALDAQSAREETAAAAKINEAKQLEQTQLSGLQKATAERQRMEQMLARSIALEDKTKVDEALTTLERPGMEGMDPRGFLPEDQANALIAARQAAADNERQRRELGAGPIGNVGDLQRALGVNGQDGPVREAEKNAAEALRASNEARIKMEQEDAIQRDARATSTAFERRRIAREANPGVYDQRNIDRADPRLGSPLDDGINPLGALNSGRGNGLPQPFLNSPLDAGRNPLGRLGGSNGGAPAAGGAGNSPLDSAAGALNGALDSFKGSGTDSTVQAMQSLTTVITSEAQRNQQRETQVKALQSQLETLKSQIAAQR